LQYDASLPAQGREWGHHLKTIGRLGRGATADQATQEIDALGRAMVAERHPETYDPNTRFAVVSLHAELTRGVRPALLAILGAVALVLVIACVNVTNLLLARGVHRQSEFALRSALGAGSGRLVRQLLTESLLLAALGGIAGLAVAISGVRALVALTPPGLPRAAPSRRCKRLAAISIRISSRARIGWPAGTAARAARWWSRKSRWRSCCSSARDCCCAAWSACLRCPWASIRHAC
jgi:hypothetical protein